MLSERAFKAIGRPLARKEDGRLITGKGRFTDDFTLSGLTWAAMVRSPYPHARILGIDPSAALAMHGVLGVYTGADCVADGLKDIPHNPVPSTQFDVKLRGRGNTPVFIGSHMLLPADRARYVGEAVAMVVAETRQQAYSAAEMVAVDYEELPWVADTVKAAAPDAPRLWDELPDNVLVDATFGDIAATDAAFARAAHVVTATYHIGRVTGVPLEPRAALGSYDAKTDRYTLYAGSGGAVRQKREIAEVLNLEPEQVRVLSFDVGGNFGTRNRTYVEFGLVLWASRKLNRPVKFRAERSECFLTDYQGRDLVTEVSLALDASGKFLALRASNLSNVGARCVSLSPLSKGSGLITGNYDIPYATLHARAVYSNTMCTQAYRSSGRPEVTFAIERLIDKAARDAALIASMLRRRNLIGPKQMPYTNPTGSIYDSGEYEINMDRLLRLADFAGVGATSRRRTPSRQAVRPGLRQLCRILDRLAQGARGSHRAPRRRRSGDRNPARGAGPRDQLRAGHRRSARSSVREGHDHPRRYRYRQRRRRHAFGPFNASRQCGHRTRRRGSDRQGDAARRASFRSIGRTGRVQRRHLQRAREPTGQSTGSSWPHRRAVQDCPSSRTAYGFAATTRCTGRFFPTAPACARSKSIPTPAASRSRAMRLSTTSAAASIR